MGLQVGRHTPYKGEKWCLKAGFIPATGTAGQGLEQGLVEVTASNGDSHSEALQAGAEVIRGSECQEQ